MYWSSLKLVLPVNPVGLGALGTDWATAKEIPKPAKINRFRRINNEFLSSKIGFSNLSGYFADTVFKRILITASCRWMQTIHGQSNRLPALIIHRYVWMRKLGLEAERQRDC
jgi:hypothetical protein